MMFGHGAAGRGWLPVHGHPAARRSLIALQLIKTVLSGARLFVTDGSNELASACGSDRGTVPILQNLDWTRCYDPRATRSRCSTRAFAAAVVARARCHVHCGCTGCKVHPNRSIGR